MSPYSCLSPRTMLDHTHARMQGKASPGRTATQHPFLERHTGQDQDEPNTKIAQPGWIQHGSAIEGYSHASSQPRPHGSSIPSGSVVANEAGLCVDYVDCHVAVGVGYSRGLSCAHTQNPLSRCSRPRSLLCGNIMSSARNHALTPPPA